MTLYWWMHWFWITILTTILVQTSVSQTLSTVQNGHQNGPYSARARFEDVSPSNIENEHGMNSQNFTRQSTEQSASQSELHRNSGPMSTTMQTEYEQSLPSLKSQPEDLLQLEAKEKMQDNSHFPEITGHETFEENWDHYAGSQLGTSSVPYKKEYDNFTSILEDENTRRHDESMHSNSSESQGPEQAMNAGEEQPVNDQPQRNPIDVLNISDTMQADMEKTLGIVNTTTDSLPVNKPVGHNYRGKSVNMEKKMQDKPRNLTLSKTKTESTPVLYVTPTPINIFTKEMKNSEEEDNVTESNNYVGIIPSKDNISITLPTNESLTTVTPDLIVRSLVTTENNTSKDSVLNAVSRERIGQNNDGRGLDAASITGIALGILASAVLVGAVSFVLYRRRYLNKPQTLNDSNPDSSGYLDDNTLRENCEEMYSLDNDSFLNSLEAMTIQNYWTDSVKHTKL